MSDVVNTRIFAGTILQVRNEADDDWIGTAQITSLSGLGLVSSEIPTATGASDFGDESRPGVPAPSDGQVGLFFFPDDPFQARIHQLIDNDEVVNFQIVLPEGTNTVATFEGYPLDMPITGQFNGAYTATLTIASNSRLLFEEPA